MTYCYSKGLEHNVYKMKFLSWENVGNYVVGTLKMTRRTKCWFCSALSFPNTCGSERQCRVKQADWNWRWAFSKALHSWVFIRDSLFVPLDESAFIPKWAHEILAPNLCSESSFGEAVDLIRQCPGHCPSRGRWGWGAGRRWEGRQSWNVKGNS